MTDIIAQPGNLPNRQDDGGSAKDRRDNTPPVRFNESIEIFPSKPLPEYDSGPVKAYVASSRGPHSREFFALVCERNLPQRQKAAITYNAIVNPAIVTLVNKGKVYWGPARQERYVFIYRDPMGQPLIKAGSRSALGWKQEEVMESIVIPMIKVLRDFQDRDFVHGAIRPENMYEIGGADKTRKIMLGEALATPASYTQPVVYETIQRGMATPIGRGQGLFSDDLYSFGVSLAVIMRVNDPLENKSHEEIIQEKIEHGSYATVTGKDRFKGSILELLRGLLQDDPTQRWTLDEVLTWMDGRRLSPKQSLRQSRAPRPMKFAGKKYFLASHLAMDLDKYPTETSKMIETQELGQWLDRALGDEDLIERVDKAVQESKSTGRGTGYEDRLSANLSIALDPTSPIRYRGLCMTAEGFGNAMAEAFTFRHDVKPFADLITQGIVLNWIAAQTNTGIDIGATMGRFDGCRNFMRQTRAGYGLERCLYLLSPDTHCLSEKLKNHMVITPEDLVHAFEDMCSKGNAPGIFMDRHIISFLSVRDSKIDSLLYDLDSPEEHKKVLANLKALAVIQKRGEMGPLPGVAKAICDVLPAVYARYHDSGVREKLEKNIRKYAETGDLMKMAGLLDNNEITNKDMALFRKAMHEYAELAAEGAKLEIHLEDKDIFGRTTGKEVAAIMSSVIAGFSILVAVFMFITKHGFF